MFFIFAEFFVPESPRTGGRDEQRLFYKALHLRFVFDIVKLGRFDLFLSDSKQHCNVRRYVLSQTVGSVIYITRGAFGVARFQTGRARPRPHGVGRAINGNPTSFFAN